MSQNNIQNDNKGAVIYCRVSSKEQVEEGNSLVTQERICREYASKKGYKIIDVYIEQGESAKTALRTELQKLMKFCTAKKNGVSAVIIYKIDRLSRNIDDYSQIRLLLKHYGVRIESTSEHFEDSPTGRFMENLIANVAQFDNDVRTERTINGMRDAVREGRYVWSAPLGYDNVRTAGKANITPNYLAPLVKQAFIEVAKHTDTLEGVRKKIVEKGLAHKNGKLYSKAQFYAMLKNQLYAGWINKFGERHKGLFEPVVSQDLFDAVQGVLTLRRRRNLHYERENPDFPLRRFVMHPCGIKATGCWAQGRTKKYPYYRFRGVGKDAQVRKETVENAFVKLFETIKLDDSKLAEFKNFVQKEIVEKNEKQNKDRQRLSKQIEDLKLQQRMIIQKNMNGVISDEILRQQLNYIDNDIRKSAIGLEEIPDVRKNLKEMVGFISEFVKNPATIWSKMSLKNKLKLQWFTFPQGIVYENGNCRTNEISILFKGKKEILESISDRVSSGNQISVPKQDNTKPEILQQLIEIEISLEIEKFHGLLKDEELKKIIRKQRR